jgi:hypothetical protein
MIAFAPGDLAAEGPIDERCIGENEQQKQEGPDQAGTTIGIEAQK